MNQLYLNVKKTKAMLFHMSQKKIIEPTIQINGTVIEFVDDFNFFRHKPKQTRKLESTC